MFTNHLRTKLPFSERLLRHALSQGIVPLIVFNLICLRSDIPLRNNMTSRKYS